jgi:hypothetical protein
MKKVLFVIARYSDHRQQIFDQKISPINRAYCEKHGFKYVEIKNDTHLEMFRNHHTWWKFTIVRDLINSGKLQDGDIITHLDADMVIVDDTKLLQTNKSFTYSICSGNTHCMGWYSLKINEWSKKMLDLLLDDNRFSIIGKKQTVHPVVGPWIFWDWFREQASWYSLAGIKDHSWESFFELPNYGWHSDKNEHTVYSIDELQKHVEILPSEYNVTEMMGESECRYLINKVEKQNVIIRHFAGGQPWLVDQWKK